MSRCRVCRKIVWNTKICTCTTCPRCSHRWPLQTKRQQQTRALHSMWPAIRCGRTRNWMMKTVRSEFCWPSKHWCNSSWRRSLRRSSIRTDIAYRPLSVHSCYSWLHSVCATGAPFTCPHQWTLICVFAFSFLSAFRGTAFALGTNYFLLLVARAMQGVASACISVCGMSIIAQVIKIHFVQ